MDFDDNNFDQDQNNQQPPVEPTTQPTQPQPIYVAQQPAPQKGGFWKIVGRIFFTLSILANFFLFMLLIVMASVMAIGIDVQDKYNEKVVAQGDAENKIAVISLIGIIDGKLSESVKNQIEHAKNDSDVKALIIRTSTPGGGVGASDRIYHEIQKYKQTTGKPVVAFMQTQATSGGYYSSVACDKIVAEPTVITGSIGVITNHFVLKELLEEKLGITPVIVKSGPRKAWPNSFIETTPEQIEYLQEKLIRPAYERFVAIVADGRQASLTESQVRVLADGSIYGATEALNKGLIDQVGYIEKAVETASQLAGITNAKVIRYEEIFSFAKILQAKSQSPFAIDRNTLNQFTAPKLMYLWTMEQ